MTIMRGVVTFTHKVSGKSFSYYGIESYYSLARVLERGLTRAHGIYWDRKELVIEYETDEGLYTFTGEEAWEFVMAKKAVEVQAIDR